MELYTNKVYETSDCFLELQISLSKHERYNHESDIVIALFVKSYRIWFDLYKLILTKLFFFVLFCFMPYNGCHCFEGGLRFRIGEERGENDGR